MNKQQIADLYDKDFYLWINENVENLKKGDLSNCDMGHIIEEIESMGISEIRELESRLEILIAHLLKWEHQKESRSSSWNGTIREQRRAINRLLDYSPSLRNKLIELLSSEKVKQGALEIFSEETGLANVDASYNIQQILDNNFLPESEYDLTEEEKSMLLDFENNEFKSVDNLEEYKTSLEQSANDDYKQNN